MKPIRQVIVLFVILVIVSPLLRAQITNLVVNGSAANFSITQDQGVSWSCNIPVGGVMTCQIWVDLNGNGTIDSTTDKSIFGTFVQTDGDTVGNNGPPDMDGKKDGHLSLNFPGFAFAPGKYILRFSNNGDVHLVSGTVAAMASPAYTISGKVTPPTGISSLNILIVAEDKKDNGGLQSFALTDASGNYTMNFTSLAAGGIFDVRIRDDYSPSIPTPVDTQITLNKSYTGVNFVYNKPVAKVVGYLKGNDNHIFAGLNLYCNPNVQGGNYNKTATTDANGFFQFGFTAAELSLYSSWQIHADDIVFPAYMMPQTPSFSVNQNDSIKFNLTAYAVDDSITGKVTVNGKAPGNQAFRMYASVSDTAETGANADPVTGAFTLYVVKKFYNYYIDVNDLPSNLGRIFSQDNYHPGDKNIVIDLQTISWTQQSSPISNDLYGLAAINANTVWATGMNGTVLTTTDGGNTWRQVTTNTSRSINTIVFANQLTGWATGENGVINKTTDGGATWNKQTSNTTLMLDQLQFLDVNNGWAVGGSDGVSVFLKTTDGGTTWNAVSTGLSGVITSVSMVNSSTGWVICGGGIYKTINGGTSWVPATVSGASFNQVKFADANNGWAVGNPGNVYHTSDAGATWYFQNTNSSTLHAIYCLNASTVWFATDGGGIFKTTDGGNTWNRQLTNYYGTLNNITFSDANNGWAVGSGGEILHTTNGGVTFIKDIAPAGRISEYTLSQNYPNPFNPETKIDFSVPVTGQVTIKLYNILGREVLTLVDQVITAGAHSVTLNASQLPSGVYFYSLHSGSTALSKKMILLK